MKFTEQNYNQFFSGLSDGLLGELGAGYKMRAVTNTRNTGILRNGILIQKDAQSSVPAIYLDDYYEDFCTGRCLNDIIRQVLYTYQSGADSSKKQSFYEIDFSHQAMKDKIILRVVNYARNAAKLRSVPCIRILDLAVVFHFMVYQDEDGIGTVQFTTEHFLSYTGASEGEEPFFTTLEELYKLALTNTKRLFPARLNRLDDVLQSLLAKKGAPPLPFAAQSCAPEDLDGKLFVFTNTPGINGAACILYPEAIEQLTQYFGSDFYILPSSIHELLLLPNAHNFYAEELNDMIREINLSQVPKEEVLSDRAYHSHDFSQMLKLPDPALPPKKP